jgi:hypothetical protein
MQAFAPAVAGTPTESKASVILPIAFCSAISSNGFILSKNLSTSEAYLVPKPRSKSSAPKDTKPSGTFITA